MVFPHVESHYLTPHAGMAVRRLVRKLQCVAQALRYLQHPCVGCQTLHNGGPELTTHAFIHDINTLRVLCCQHCSNILHMKQPAGYKSKKLIAWFTRVGQAVGRFEKTILITRRRH